MSAHPSSLNPALTPIELALDNILEQLKVTGNFQTVSLANAQGCILTEDQVARIDVPMYDNSAMDGFVVNVEGLKQGDTLSISQVIAAGHPGVPLDAGTAARIFTGAAIPENTNAVVMQENTEHSEGRVTILQLPSVGENIRLRGHDIETGSTVLKAGHRLRAQDLGLLASLGISEVSVCKPLKVAIINTGDEVVSPDQQLEPGQLYDSNSFTLDALLQKLGMETIKLGIVEDSLDATKGILSRASELADCIITTGGVSVGDEDHVKAAVESLGELNLWKLAIKPGKPFSFGYVNNKPFFGLPGNPVAVFVTFTMLVRACLLKLQGATSIKPPVYQVPAGFDLTKGGSRQEYIRVCLQENDGKQELVPFGNQGSSIVTSLSWADGLAIIPMNTLVNKGDLLDYIPFEALLS